MRTLRLLIRVHFLETNVEAGGLVFDVENESRIKVLGFMYVDVNIYG